MIRCINISDNKGFKEARDICEATVVTQNCSRHDVEAQVANEQWSFRDCIRNATDTTYSSTEC